MNELILKSFSLPVDFLVDSFYEVVAGDDWDGSAHDSKANHKCEHVNRVYHEALEICVHVSERIPNDVDHHPSSCTDSKTEAAPPPLVISKGEHEVCLNGRKKSNNDACKDNVDEQKSKHRVDRVWMPHAW